MNQWPNGQTNGMFPSGNQGHITPANMYNNLGGSGQFDISQFTQGLQNGNGNSSTPSFSGQTFQPGSVVPAKRSHDGMSGSPVQNQGSRSQTPNYPGFANQQAGQQFQSAPTPYAHLQQTGSSNATPSPTMQNQQFRPPAQQSQRMQNASPNPFPQQQNNFGNQMSPVSSQNPNHPTNMQQNQMGGAFNQQFGGMNTNASMSGMANQMNSMGQMNAQKAYQMKLMQHQQQLRNSGMIPPRAAGGQSNQMMNSAQQMMNGQQAGQMNMANQQQQQAQKRSQFLKTIAGHATQSGRQFNPSPTINGRPVDLYALWTLVGQLGGSQNADRNQQWQQIATRLGFPDAQYPNAASELRQLYALNISQYERLWFAMHASKKQEEARMHAQQMAGLGGPGQASPTRTMQNANQPNPYAQLQQGQQNQMQPLSTPVQANAQLPQNGMVTPQQQMLQHRRASSVRKPELMTPQAGVRPLTAQSSHSGEKAAQGSPSAKQENAPAVMKSEETRSTRYMPARLTVEWDGGYNTNVLNKLSNATDTFEFREARFPFAPKVEEMGTIDMRAITLSLASGIHSEVRYALDALGEITNYKQPSFMFELRKCEDLLDVIVDCAEEQIELLSEDAAEVSDALDLTPYEDIMRSARDEAEALQEIPEFGTHAFDLDRAADKLIAITTILRNMSFFETNHEALTSPLLIKWLSNTIRLLGTRNMLLRTFYNAQDFYKDIIIFLSNITQSLELPSREDALHVLHFLLAFAPQPAPSYTDSEGKLRFTNYIPYAHRYLPPAVDSLAKLLARQDPNRMLYKSIFTASSSTSESPLNLLTRAFALSISVLPDRTKPNYLQNQITQIVEARKAFISQGMLAADILSMLVPSSEADVARAWIESEDGWAVGLCSLASALSLDRTPQPPPQQKPGQLPPDSESLRLIAQRALTMMRRLAEKARNSHHPPSAVSRSLLGKSAVPLTNGEAVTNGDHGDDAEEVEEDEGLSWVAMPHNHTVMGALLTQNVDRAALGLLCGLHDMAMQGQT